MKSDVKDNKPLLISVKEASKISGLCYRTIKQVMNKPSCTFKKQIGKRIYIYRPKFEQWLSKTN